MPTCQVRFCAYGLTPRTFDPMVTFTTDVAVLVVPVAVTVNDTVPLVTAVGVPEMTPVAGFTLRPAGSDGLTE